MIGTEIIFHKEDEVSNLKLDSLVVRTRYRAHPRLNEHDEQQLFRHELAMTLQCGGICASAERNNAIIASCAIKPLKWDSQHFGLPMAKLTLAAAPRCPIITLETMLKKVMNAISQTTNLHISSEVDIDEYQCLNALIGLGFEIMDIKREFRWTHLKGVRAPKLLSKVRDYKLADKNQVMLLANRLQGTGRFYRDSVLPIERTRQMYQSWLSQLLDKNGCGSIALVFEKNGEVAACGVIEEVGLSPSGHSIRLMNNGLYISTQGTGGYYPVIYSLAERSLALHDSVQTSVSLNNHAAIRVLERMNGGTETTRISLRLNLTQDGFLSLTRR